MFESSKVIIGGQEYSVRFTTENNKIVIDSIYHLDGYGVEITDDLESEILEKLQ